MTISRPMLGRRARLAMVMETAMVTVMATAMVTVMATEMAMAMATRPRSRSASTSPI
jgi:hypothetical protein